MKPAGVSFHVKRDAERLRVPLTDEQARVLERFHDLLTRKAVPLGLVSEGDADRIYERHLLDSLAAATAFEAADRLSLDLGSGAGLPGVVLAIALPGIRFLLVEPMRRRIAFLELAVEALGLTNVEILGERVEKLPGKVGPADVATARAFAPPLESWKAAAPLLRPGGRLIYFLGRRTSLEEADLRSVEYPPASLRVTEVLDSSMRLAIIART